MDEFSFIKEYLSSAAKSSPSIDLGIGDDCAVLTPIPGKKLCISTDAQIDGRHFPEGSPWNLVLERAIGCAYSDLSAMGATPVGMTLALSLPELTIHQAELIQSGLRSAQVRYPCPLVGGDTTQGPKMVSVTVFGYVEGTGLLRSNAQEGEDVWLTGAIGDAAFALGDLTEFSVNKMSRFQSRYWFPPNRNLFAQDILPIASACLDLSDGLSGDVAHILRASNVGMDLFANKLPLSEELLAVESLSHNQAVELALAGGDDYELLFTAPTTHREAIKSLANLHQLRVSCIGKVTGHINKLNLVTEDGATRIEDSGFKHF